MMVYLQTDSRDLIMAACVEGALMVLDPFQQRQKGRTYPALRYARLHVDVYWRLMPEGAEQAACP